MPHKAIFRPKGVRLGLISKFKIPLQCVKMQTKWEKKFHDIALIISREIYVFVRSGFFRGSRKKSTLAKGTFLALVRHTDIVRFQLSLLLLIFTTVYHKTGGKTTLETIKILKIHIFSRSAREATVNRTPKV